MGCIITRSMVVLPINKRQRLAYEKNWLSFSIYKEFIHHQFLIGSLNSLQIPLKNLLLLINILSNNHYLSIFLSINQSNYYNYLLTLWKKIEVYQNYGLDIDIIIDMINKMKKDISFNLFKNFNFISFNNNIKLNLLNKMDSMNVFKEFLRLLLKEIYYKLFIPSKYSKQIQNLNNIIKNKEKIRIKDFDIYQLLGKGTYSKVYLCKKKTTKKLYAMKIIEKNKLLELYQYDMSRITLEIKILSINTCPYIVDSKYIFHTKQFIIIAMDLGIDLLKLTYEYDNNILPNELLRFYTAEIIIAIEYIHNQGIIIRDLKPSNVIVTKSGHIKLIDFGGSYILNKNIIHWENNIIDIKAINYINKYENQLDKDCKDDQLYNFYKSYLINNQLNNNDQIIDVNQNKHENINTYMKRIQLNSLNNSKDSSLYLEYDKNDVIDTDISIKNDEYISNNHIIWNETLKRSGSILGTFGYMAPEMIFQRVKNRLEYSLIKYQQDEENGNSNEDYVEVEDKKENKVFIDTYDNRIDFYSLGATMYRCIVGHKLYEKEITSNIQTIDINNDNDELSINKIYKNKKKDLKKWENIYNLQRSDSIEYPNDINNELIDLMTNLLTDNVFKRYGIYDDDRNIKRHPYYHSINWELLERQQIEPPFIPSKVLAYESINHSYLMKNKTIFNDEIDDDNDNDILLNNEIFDDIIYISDDCIDLELNSILINK